MIDMFPIAAMLVAQLPFLYASVRVVRRDDRLSFRIFQVSTMFSWAVSLFVCYLIKENYDYDLFEEFLLVFGLMFIIGLFVRSRLTCDE